MNMWIKITDGKIINTRFIIKLYIQQKTETTPVNYGIETITYCNVYDLICILVNGDKEILCEYDSLEKAQFQLDKFLTIWNK